MTKVKSFDFLEKQGDYYFAGGREASSLMLVLFCPFCGERSKMRVDDVKTMHGTVKPSVSSVGILDHIVTCQNCNRPFSIVKNKINLLAQLEAK